MSLDPGSKPEEGSLPDMRSAYSVTAGLPGAAVVALVAPFVPVSAGLAAGAHTSLLPRTGSAQT